MAATSKSIQSSPSTNSHTILSTLPQFAILLYIIISTTENLAPAFNSKIIPKTPRCSFCTPLPTDFVQTSRCSYSEPSRSPSILYNEPKIPMLFHKSTYQYLNQPRRCPCLSQLHRDTVSAPPYLLTSFRLPDALIRNQADPPASHSTTQRSLCRLWNLKDNSTNPKCPF